MRHRLQAAAVAAAMLALPGVAAAHGKGHGGAPGVPKVIASGLDNPRGLAFGPDGALYVAEAGLGGTSCLPIPLGEATQSCTGTTGGITRIKHGQQRRIVKGLPSIAGSPEGAAATGVHDIAFGRHGRPYVVTGLGGDPAIRASLPNGSAHAILARIGWKKTLRQVSDIGAVESATNPDGGAVDSNPFSVVAGRHGTIYVSDAGGNSVLKVRHGKAEVIATFADRMVDAPEFLGLPPGTQIPMQAVPTGIVRGPDGALYVGELTGFPFQVGAARVWRIVPGKAPTVYAEGFTNITDVAFDRRGNLYVLQATSLGLASGDSPGSLVRVSKNGTRTTVVDGLVLPTGLTIRKHHAYITNKSVIPSAGEVLRVRLPR